MYDEFALGKSGLRSAKMALRPVVRPSIVWSLSARMCRRRMATGVRRMGDAFPLRMLVVKNMRPAFVTCRASVMVCV
jgi:hypothetical protein